MPGSMSLGDIFRNSGHHVENLRLPCLLELTQEMIESYECGASVSIMDTKDHQQFLVNLVPDDRQIGDDSKVETPHWLGLTDDQI